jgi:hypothetical protein
MAGAIGQELKDAGFDVYEPGRNAEAPAGTRSDRRLHGMLHGSLLSALDACSMVVIPYDGRGLVHGVESTEALWYALEHPRVPCLLAYDHVDAAQLADFECYGLQLAKVDRSHPWDVSAAIDAVDRMCAAYECLRPSAGPPSRAAT